MLRQLFSRFLAFLAGLARELKAEGTSATMEKASPLQVHLHAYLHLAQPFHRRGRDALQVFEFEGVRPHLSPNTTSGKGYMGAVRHGHFYVVVDKIVLCHLVGVVALRVCMCTDICSGDSGKAAA